MFFAHTESILVGIKITNERIVVIEGKVAES